MRGLFVTGTDTGVGKTLVTAALIRLARRRGADVVGIKPIATGAIQWEGEARARHPHPCPSSEGRGVSEDALELFEANDRVEPLEAVNTILFRAPRAPLVAAAMEGTCVDIARALDCCRAVASRHGAVLVEGVGGLLVPLTEDATVADFALQAGLPLLIVARAGLGTINHTALTVREAWRAGLSIAGVVLNSPGEPDNDDLVRSNRAEIERLCGVNVFAVLPHVSSADAKRAAELLEPQADWKTLLAGG